jgi:pimeloyl-ACP methyl ester carboxylesterase
MTPERPPFHPFRSEAAKVEFEAFYAEKAKRWPIPAETRLVDTPSARTFVRVSGHAEDPPLFLLAGARGTSLMWAPNIRALSARRRTYALDTVGDIGLSLGRAPLSTTEAAVRWLDEVFGALVPERPLDLMGMSYGGWLAAEYAVRFPGRLRKVVLLAPGATVRGMSLAFVLRIALIGIPLPGRSGGPVTRMLRWLFRDFVNGGGDLRDVLDIVRLDRFFDLPWLPWPRVLDDAAWRSLRVPTLFLVGANEKIYSPAAAVKRLGRVAPQVRAEIVHGAGHDLPLVKADLVAARVLDFLDAPAVA